MATGQLRVDFAFEVSTLQAEVSCGLALRSLLIGNRFISELKKSGDWRPEFGLVDLASCCVVAVSHAALGNVDCRGGLVGSKTRSQCGFLVFLGDDNCAVARLAASDCWTTVLRF